MKWDSDADKAIEKVPFFVRKRVRARVEETSRAAGRNRVTLADVNTTRQRFLNKMADEVTGYQVDACFGAGGCQNRIITGNLPEKIEHILKASDLPGFLRDQLGENIKFHHEFRVTVSDCPNACSQPQIRDIGIIAASLPHVTDNECISCMECVNICKEDAITFDDLKNRPVIDVQKCVKCGQCHTVCHTRTLDPGVVGFRILVGGKLGRHPRLAEELPGIYSEADVLEVVRHCINYRKTRSRNGERFAELVAKDKKFISALIREINRVKTEMKV